jgi:hypothetical protein
LQEKLQTPLGRAYLAKLQGADDPISLGMLYQLTGRREYAEQAFRQVQSYGENIDPKPAGSGSTGHRFVETALAFDLCYDAWPEAFRRELVSRIVAVLEHRQRRLHPGHANYHPSSNYYGPSHGSGGLGALAVWGEKGPPPVRPEPPPGVGQPPPRIPPTADYQPEKGVPVSRFTSDQMPAEWLFVGGFKPRDSDDPLAALGGAAKARPQPGTHVAYGDRSEQFRPIPHEEDKGYWVHPAHTAGQKSIDVTNAIGRIYHSTSYFYTVIDNEQPRWVRVVTDWDPAVVYLNGVRLQHGRVARLEKGLYPLMVVAAIGETQPWARILMRPRLIELTAQQAEAALAEQRAEYQFDLALWKFASECWDRSDGVDQHIELLCGLAHQRLYWHYRLGIGDGGFIAETGAYGTFSSWYPLIYAAAYRRMFGRDASPYPDITHLLPRRMMQIVFYDDGSTWAQKISSAAGFDPHWWAAGFPIVPEQYQPALLWAWNKVRKVTSPETVGNIIIEREKDSGLRPTLAFVNYPLEMKPVHPEQGMPRTWRADGFGYYCFRSGWQGKDEFIGQVYLKAAPVVAWNHGDAGTFRVFGFDYEWVTGAEERNGSRPQEPVVLLPDDQTNDGGCGRLLYLRTEQDGSGSMSIDLSDVYGRTQRETFDRNLLRLPDAPPPSISGLRAIAFDYSGRSGCPALMVLADKIEGGKQKLWQWTLHPSQLKHVKLAEDSFCIERSNASLKATFVAPRPVALSAGVDTVRVGDPRHGFHGQVARIKATGGDAFFVVITWQQKEPPRVEIAGQGLGATVRVGGQTVRFDGTKLLLGP